MKHHVSLKFLKSTASGETDGLADKHKMHKQTLCCKFRKGWRNIFCHSL